jgi:KDO2-lipid IV(A) lauroyltransferase
MRKRLEYAAYRALAAVVPLLPRRVVVFLGRRLGFIYHLFDRRGRVAGRENLARFRPDLDPRRVLREGARLQAVSLLDALWARRLTPKRARKYFHIKPEDEALLLDLQGQGRGIVLATAHFGSWELLNSAAGAMGLPRATVIARPVNNAYVDRHIHQQREATGNRVVHREQAAMACMAALRRGELVCSVIDMAVLPSEGGVYADFYGLPAMTSGVLPYFAHRRNAPLFLIVATPLEKGLRYRLDTTRIMIDGDADRDAEVLRATAEMNRLLQGHIDRMPEAWIWGYKRWKWRPGEFRGPYPSYSHWVAKAF